MMISPEWTANILQTLALVGGGAAGLAALMAWMARNFLVTKDELRQHQDAHELAQNAIEQRLSEGEAKFAALHAELARMPDQKDLLALTGRVAAMEGMVRAQTAAIDGQGEIMKRIDRQLEMLIQFHLTEKA